MNYFTCPNCGVVDEVNIYNDTLKRIKFKIAPVLPTCIKCGSEVVHSLNDEHKRRVVVLIGACGSGKTTIAEALMHEHGYNAIDLDCMIDILKHKYPDKKLEFNSPEGLHEIENCIEILKCFDNDIVLSLVVLPEEIERYREIFIRQKLDYHMYFLSADMDTLMNRTRTRKCFKSPTPEEWVVYFHDKLKSIQNIKAEDLTVIDNNYISVSEVTDIILST